MSYWVYEHWCAEHKAMVHTGHCGHCNDGRGCHQHLRGESNSRWLGPYPSFRVANSVARATGRPVRVHKCASGMGTEA